MKTKTIFISLLIFYTISTPYLLLNYYKAFSTFTDINITTFIITLIYSSSLFIFQHTIPQKYLHHIKKITQKLYPITKKEFHKK